MMRGLIDYLDDYLADVGPVGLLEGGLGVLGFGSVLSALFGDGAIKAGAIVAVMLCVLGMFLILAASRRRWRRSDEVSKALLRKYCLALVRDRPYWRLTKWQQVVVVEPNGDSKLTITVHAVSEMDQLPFFKLTVGPGWNQPLRFRRRVSVQVRSLAMSGIGGTRCDQTHFWREDGRLDVYAHFASPAALGTEFRVVAEVLWPGRSRPLTVDRQPDEFCMTPPSPMRLLEYTVVLPEGEEVFCDPIGFGIDQDNFSLISRTNPAGRTEVCLSGHDLVPDNRIGMRLDLKPR